MSEYITMRDCLKLDLKDAIAERNSLQDQRDFAMGEIDRLRKERDEAREVFAVATDQLVQAQAALRKARDRCWKLGRDRNLARKLADSAMLEADRLRAQLHKQ